MFFCRSDLSACLEHVWSTSASAPFTSAQLEHLCERAPNAECTSRSDLSACLELYIYAYAPDAGGWLRAAGHRASAAARAAPRIGARLALRDHGPATAYCYDAIFCYEHIWRGFELTSVSARSLWLQILERIVWTDTFVLLNLCCNATVACELATLYDNLLLTNDLALDGTTFPRAIGILVGLHVRVLSIIGRRRSDCGGFLCGVTVVAVL